MALGDLIFRMAADIATLQSDLGRATHVLDRFASRANKTLSVLGAGISVAGITAFVTEAVDAAARLDDLSEITGASVENLSKLSQVARISGTSMETVEKFITKLNKALHTNAEEGKDARAALAAIGLSAEQLRSLDPAEAMVEIAKAMSEFEDSGAKAAAATALTGKSAAQALPFLKDLATEQGIVAKVTAEQAAQAEELQKSIRRLTNAATEAAQALVREVVPTMSRFLEQLSEGMRIAGGFGEALRLFGLSTITSSNAGAKIAEIGKELEELHARRARFAEQGRTGFLPNFDREIADAKKRLEFAKVLQRQEALAGISNSFRDERRRFGGSLKQLDFETPGIKGAGAVKQSEAERALQQLEDEARKVQDLTRFQEVLAAIEAGRYGKLTVAQRDALLNAAAAVDLAKEDARVQKEAASATEQYLKAEQERIRVEGERLTQIADRTKDILDPTRIWKREVEDLVRAYERGLLTLDQLNAASGDPRLRALVNPPETDRDVLNRALKEGDISLDKYLEVIQRLNGETEKQKSLVEDLGLTFVSAFEKAIVEGGKLSDVIKSLGKDIAQIIARKTITEPLGNALSGLFKSDSTSASGSSGGGGLFGGLFGGLWDWITNKGGVVGSFDVGTDFVPRTGLAMVHRGEAIIPADENHRRDQPIIINVAATDAASFNARLAQRDTRRLLRGIVAEGYAQRGRVAPFRA